MESHNEVVDSAAGDEFSIFVTKNKLTNETEVFGCGHNLKGQLGAGFMRHICDIIKIEGLSNYKIKVIWWNRILIDILILKDSN